MARNEDILSIGDYSSRSSLSFVWGRVGFVTYVCLLMKFFGGACSSMGFPDRGPFDLNLVGTLNICELYSKVIALAMS